MSGPLRQEMLAPAIEALRRGELGVAVGTGRSGRESVEGLAAASALPVGAERGSSVAGGAGKSLTARQLRHAKQSLRMFESSPTVDCHVDGDRAQPEVSFEECERDKSGDAEQAQDRCRHQAAGAAQDKPKQGTENLAAIQRIDRKDIEDEETRVDVQNGANEFVDVGMVYAHPEEPPRK